MQLKAADNTIDIERVDYYSMSMQARIQDSEGGGRTFRRGGGSYRNFRSGSKLLQGPGQINKQKKIEDSRRGGGPITPQKNLYPRLLWIILNQHVQKMFVCKSYIMLHGLLRNSQHLCVKWVSP